MALGAIAIGQEARAQGAPPSGGEQTELAEVVVTGIRSSMESSQDIKKNSEVFVDSVTAEDIGALPDRSVTEALQRIPGVSISRFAGANDPDHFSIEGTGVVVRGLNQVRSELNGRDTFSANSGRFLSFSDVPPELLYGVDVFKNQSADMIEGGLAGSVNLRTRVPFDQDGQLIGGSLEGNYGDFQEEFSPTGSILYSNRWETGAGDFGILANIVYSELSSRSDGVQISSFKPRDASAFITGGTGTVYVPEGAAFRTQDYDRERTGGALALQWANPSDTMLATLQFMRSDATTAWAEHAVEIATDNVGDTAFYQVPGTPAFTFNDSGVFTSGVISAPVGWRDDQFSGNNRIPVNGLQSNNITRSVDQTYMTQDIGFNFKWTPNDNWALTFDAQRIDSTVENLDMTIWGSTYQDVALDLTGEIPQVQFLPVHQVGDTPGCTPPQQNCPLYFSGTHNSYADPFNSFWRSAMDHAEDSEGVENAFRFDIEQKFGEGESFLKSHKFGLRFADRDQTTRSTTYNWGVLSEIWGNGGPVWFDEPVDGVPPPTAAAGSPTGGSTGVFTFDNFMRGKAPVPTLVPFYNASELVGGGYDELAAFAAQIGAEWRANTGADNSWERLDDPRRPGVGGAPQVEGHGGRFLPREINETSEQTKSLYYMIRFGADLGGDANISGNVGLRWVRTDFDATGTVASLNPAQLMSEDDCFPAPPQQPSDNGFCDLSLEERERARRFATNETTPVEAGNDYENWLPSLNVKVQMTEDKLLRFGFSKAIARPDLGLMRYYYLIEPYLTNNNTEWLGFQVRTGNPYLKPTESTQYDGSFEWYYARAGSLTFSLFYKSLKNVLTNEITSEDFSAGGETYSVRRPSPVNAKDRGKVQGAEIAYQQFFDFLPGFWSGFGVQANYTYIDSSGVKQSVLSSGGSTGVAENEANVDTSKLPLVGLSEDNANLALIYEKGPVSARAAYNWRSEYLLTTRDVITPFAPIVQEATGQLDASFFYSINEHLKIGIQGVNLLDEVTQTSQVLNDQLLQAGRSWFINDRRFSIGLRASF